MEATYLVSAAVIAAGCVALSWFCGKDAPYVATEQARIDQALDLAEIAPGQIFYELGSGDGRVVYAAAARGAKAIGVEESLIRVWQSRIRARRRRLANASFIHGDIFARNYSDADVVFIYLLPRGVVKLETKLRQELKPGAKVITQRYHFSSWQPSSKAGDYNLYIV